MGAKIKEYRKELGLTQQKLAETLGVRQNTVCLWEQGKRSPSIKMCRKMAGFFGATLNELFGEE